MIPALEFGAIACLLCTAAAVPFRSTNTVTGTNLISKLSDITSNPPIAGSNTNTSTALSTLVSKLAGDEASKNPDIDSAQSAWPIIERIFSGGVTSIVDAGTEVVSEGLIPPEVLSFLDGYSDSELNSISNKNPPAADGIYPSKSVGDAPYSVSEEKLRGTIHIPESFSHGKDGRTPLILVPGTAVPAGTTYHYSFGKLGDPADIVWVNIPRASLNDVQVNAEYVAYAINYISAICGGSKVATLTWSQGGVDMQWALKYWPSTREVVEDFIAISPDFHGTVEANGLCPALDYIACTPSIWQQAWDAELIETLRDGGGDSGYVPTTTVYSSFDEIVEPMSGDNASAILSDERNMGVTNNHLQTICPGQPAGGVYTHEGVLYNPVAWALAIDALRHDGPGKTSRINVDEVCAQFLPPQLEVDDMLGTEGLLLVALAEILGYTPEVTSEPPIKGYARTGSSS